jgi:calcineurin-like phosphoesterase family protein
MECWFTSDHHFGHHGILKHTTRPWASAEEMDAALIRNWNDRVAPGDRVFYLGDLSFHKPPVTREIVSRLNGEIHLIWGNHDEATVRKLPDVFASVQPFLEVKLWDQHITLCHYALRVWSRSHYGSWSLYGHSHGTLPDDPNSLSMDVGVDPNGYYPISFEKVKAHMARKEFRPVDHHGAA